MLFRSLVAYVLPRYGGSNVPQEIQQYFRERLLRTARINLAFLQEWQRVLNVLGEAKVPVISLKGPALAFTAYRNPALREFVDLDLLVQPCDVVRARDVLVRNGYLLDSVVLDDTDASLIHSSNREISFVKEERGITVELHWGVLHEMFPFQLDVGQLFESACVEHQERISFLSLSPAHLLLYLCAHGTKHCWSNLRWLCDVACHVQANPSLDWDLCIRLAEPAGCELVLKHSLLLTGQVLGLELPDPIAQYASQDTKAHMLAKIARTFLFRENDDHPGYLEALRYYLAFAQGWREGAWLVFARVFIPAEQDWQYVRLPLPLRFLYYLVRPIRFVLERLSVAVRLSL